MKQLKLKLFTAEVYPSHNVDSQFIVIHLTKEENRCNQHKKDTRLTINS